MKAGKTKHRYPEEFKRDVVTTVAAQGYKVSEATRIHGINAGRGVLLA